MAIRPVRSINELNLNAFKQVFKSVRDVGTGLNFQNLFVAGLEHILVYKKGERLEEFIGKVFEMIGKDELDSVKEAFNDVFEDLEELMRKKQMKILNSMIFDYNFSNFLTNFAEIIEIPINKSSVNESFNEIFFLSEVMKINIKIVDAKWKESKLVKSDGIVSLYLFDDKGKFLILFPLEYKEFYNENKEKSMNLDDVEEDMRKINFLDFECKVSTRSLSEVAKVDRKRDLSVGFGKDEKEERMRNRAKALKAKREQKRIEDQIKKAEEERLEELRKQEMEKIRIEKEREELEKMKDRIRLEEENKILKEWKLSEDLKKADHQAQLLKDIESNTFNPDYFSKEIIQVIESLHRNEEAKLHEERDQIELQKNQLEQILHEKEKLNEEIKKSAQKMIDEEQKLLEEKVLYELQKQELQQVIAAEREELVKKQKEEEKKLKQEKEKLELMRIDELKKLEEEKRKIEQRRLAEDKKIAEQKRIAAEMKLNEMKKIIDDLKIRSKTPQDSNQSFNSFSSKLNEKLDHSSENQKTIQNIISSIEKSQKHKRNFSHGPKIPQLPQESLTKPQSRPITAISIHPPDENFIKNYSKYKNRVKLNQSSQSHPNPLSNPISPSNAANPAIPQISQNPQLKSLNSLSSISSSPRSKQDTWLETQKKLIESRRLELGKILENTKKIEFKRDSKRRNSEDKSVLEESKKILEAKKKIKAGRFTSLDEHAQNNSMVEKSSKNYGSVLESGFFDDIFNKSFNVSDESFIDPLQDIREFKSKHLNESDAELLEKEKNEAYIKLDSVNVVEDLEKNEPRIEDDMHEKEENCQAIEKIEENLGFCDNKSICGGIYCMSCMKDLKKSSLYLKCKTCCINFSDLSTLTSGKKVLPSKKQICLKCSNKVLKGEEIWCLCCFIQLKIHKKPFTCCESCQNPGKLSWIDSSLGDAMILCNFCGENRDKNCVLEICGRCQELICIICLRKNPYVASSICSTCLNRRQVKVHV